MVRRVKKETELETDTGVGEGAQGGPAPVIDEEGDPWVYLVLVGSDTYLSSAINRGRPIYRDEVVRMVPLMAELMLTREQPDSRSNAGEMVKFFRPATDKEIAEYNAKYHSSEFSDMTPSDKAKAAVRQALAAGEGSTTLLQDTARKNAVMRALSS